MRLLPAFARRRQSPPPLVERDRSAKADLTSPKPPPHAAPQAARGRWRQCSGTSAPSRTGNPVARPESACQAARRQLAPSTTGFPGSKATRSKRVNATPEVKTSGRAGQSLMRRLSHAQVGLHGSLGLAADAVVVTVVSGAGRGRGTSWRGALASAALATTSARPSSPSLLGMRETRVPGGEKAV